MWDLLSSGESIDDNDIYKERLINPKGKGQEGKRVINDADIEIRLTSPFGISSFVSLYLF